MQNNRHLQEPRGFQVGSNARISGTINVIQNVPKMTHTNTTQRAHKISISDKIESSRDDGQIDRRESETKEEGHGHGSIVLCPQVNDNQAHIFPHSSHFKVVIDSLKGM